MVIGFIFNVVSIHGNNVRRNSLDQVKKFQSDLFAIEVRSH